VAGAQRISKANIGEHFGQDSEASRKLKIKNRIFRSGSFL
jgi:hypothetical protein